MKWVPLVLGEAVASARSQKTASLLTVLLVAALMVTVLLTTGRTVGSEQRVLGAIDSVGTRSIVIRADAGAGLTSDAVTRIARLAGVQWVGGFSTPLDATNSEFTDGAPVAARFIYATHLEPLGISTALGQSGQLAYASEPALQQLGLPDIAGGVTLSDGESFGVANRISTPPYLKQFAPLLLIPRPLSRGAEPISLIVIVSSKPTLVGTLSTTALSLLAATDSTKVTVQTSEQLAQLRSLIQEQLGTFSRGLVLALLGVTLVLVGVVLFGLVLLRRKDFGRRRALGATRSFIVALLVTQASLLSVSGVLLGWLVAFAITAVSGDPQPGAEFTFALAIMAFVTTALASLLPALVASRREPVEELRVP